MSKYWVRRGNGKPQGPVTGDQLRDLLKSGKVKGTDEFSLDQVDWLPASAWLPAAPAIATPVAPPAPPAPIQAPVYTPVARPSRATIASTSKVKPPTGLYIAGFIGSAMLILVVCTVAYFFVLKSKRERVKSDLAAVNREHKEYLSAMAGNLGELMALEQEMKSINRDPQLYGIKNQQELNNRMEKIVEKAKAIQANSDELSVASKKVEERAAAIQENLDSIEGMIRLIENIMTLGL